MTWVKANADIKLGSTWITFKGEMDNANSVNLSGSGTVVLNGYKCELHRPAVIQNNSLKISGTADIVTSLFGVRLTGTIEKADMNSSVWVFTGSAGFRFGGYTIAGASVRLDHRRGHHHVVRCEAVRPVRLHHRTYKLYFTGTELSRIQLNSPVVSWPLFFSIAKITAPNIPVETTITGLL